MCPFTFSSVLFYTLVPVLLSPPPLRWSPSRSVTLISAAWPLLWPHPPPHPSSLLQSVHMHTLHCTISHYTCRSIDVCISVNCYMYIIIIKMSHCKEKKKYIYICVVLCFQAAYNGTCCSRTSDPVWPVYVFCLLDKWHSLSYCYDVL